jgi:hypothetical protein
MHRVGFEPTIPVFLRAKTVNALDRTDITRLYNCKISFKQLISSLQFQLRLNVAQPYNEKPLCFYFLLHRVCSDRKRPSTDACTQRRQITNEAESKLICKA